MEKVFLKSLKSEQLKALVKRPAVKLEKIIPGVRQILEDVKTRGDEAVRKYSKDFDKIELKDFFVSKAELEKGDEINLKLRQAIKAAAGNIKKFHQAQVPAVKEKPIETARGVRCWRETRPIEKVGLYVPRGLFSTVLMLGIPAGLAGCKEIVMTTPPDKQGNLTPAMLFAAKIAGITKIFKIGGVQAVAAMAFGTESVPKVDKLFGPGNQYVTAAKMLVSVDPFGVAVDLPAGPSEILLIADSKANPAFVAADLLSQLEHGPDSQAVLATDSQALAAKTEKEIKLQNRCSATKQMSVQNLLYVMAESTEQAVAFANLYAPEHLVLNVEKPEKYINKIKNVGSVFTGPYSPVAAGDYASGTNHVLPTAGWAKAYSGLSVADFLKTITFQKISRQGLKNIAQTITTLADIEKMPAHKNSLAVRADMLYD